MPETEKIISEYGKVMELNSGYSATSERFLPFPKKQIKAAILSALIQEKDKTQRESLRAGYIRLATFLSDDDATVIARFESRMLEKSTNTKLAHPEDLSLQARYSEIQNNIAKDMKILTKEIETSA